MYISDFFIFWKLTECRYFVTYLSNNPHNLVPAEGVISLAGKVTEGLVESNGNLPPGVWLMSHAGWLPRNEDQLRAQRS